MTKYSKFSNLIKIFDVLSTRNPNTGRIKECNITPNLLPLELYQLRNTCRFFKALPKPQETFYALAYITLIKEFYTRETRNDLAALTYPLSAAERQNIAERLVPKIQLTLILGSILLKI